MGYLGDADSLIAKCCCSLSGGQWTPLLIIARRNWRYCLCKSSGGKQCILSSLGAMGRSATSTGHRVNSMRDGRRTGCYARPRTHSLLGIPYHWRGERLAYKRNMAALAWFVVVVCVLLPVDFTHGLYFHMGETEKKCFIEEIPDETMVTGEFFYHAFNSRSTLFRVHIS